ncbi:MAG: HAMP domain-containing protein, partial [Deltaproteobacteria bacterium]|nr:HAMP domain-containing protein [Deltaproteobacteria bacterium]
MTVKTTLGIRAQLIIGIVIMTLAGIGMIGLISIKIIESRAVSWKISEAEKTVRLARSSLMRYTSDDAQKSLALLSSALMSADVSGFRLSDASGRVILKEGSLAGESGAVISHSDGVKVRLAGAGWLNGAGSALFVEAALEGPRFGRGGLSFTVPMADIKEDMAAVRRFLLIYAALDSIIIIAFGLYFLSRSIVAPLKKLEAAAVRISGGALGERADAVVDNEVGSLALSFNRMAGRLEDEIKTLERVNTELLRTQDELLRSSTLAAVGSLAAGIAHEIGNPLGAVRGYMDILSKAAKEEGGDKDIIDRCAKEVERIDAIVREFLELSRPSKRALRPQDVAGLLQEAVSTAAVHKDFEGVDVAASGISGDLPEVMIDEGKLRQVFMNLLLNAAQAMKGQAGKRTVTVEAFVERHPVDRMARLKRRKDDQQFLFPGTEAALTTDFVMVRITDTGAGISPEDARMVFDPFFTTKDRASGLGLAISYSIVKKHGGAIIAESSKDGATFSVYLPAAAEKEEYRPLLDTIVRGNGRILVMD